MKDLFRKLRGAGAGLSYDDSKRLISNEGPAARSRLAERSDVRPEVLYYLAGDPSPEVRRRIAVNTHTPVQADLILARDDDEAVRRDLAAKVARLLPHLPEKDREQARRHVVGTLELLARDQAIRVRQILAEALRDVADAPASVIRQLARDAEDVVACPVLEFSPLLSDLDLIEIIEEGCASARLNAISRREDLGTSVTDAIVISDDREAIAGLLANHSAQIREETLDSLVDQARQVTLWQEPLVERPRMSGRMVYKLATFVAENLLEKLRNRKELDRETALRVAEEVRRRLSDAEAPLSEENGAAKDLDCPLHGTGEPDDEILFQALARGDRALVREGLILRSGLDETTVARILEAGSAKGLTALAWKAGLSMRFAAQLQLRMGGIPPGQVLNGRNGTDYPLAPEEMNWQLEFFESLTG